MRKPRVEGLPPTTTRRRDRRAYARPLLDLRVAVLSDGFQHECRTVDASRDGMAVELTPSLAEQDPHFVYRYALEVEGGRRIPITGRTAWRRGRLQGVRFVVISDSDRAAFEEVLLGAAPLGASDAERLDFAEDVDRWWGERRAAALRAG
jgi:hypothetical protein